jgi:hypothetical protein
MMSSATATVCDNLALYGSHASILEDNRDYPCEDRITQEVGSAMEAMKNLCASTKLEEDEADILWGMVNVFHGMSGRLARKIGDAQAKIRELIREQDGSEIQSVSLEEAQALAEALEEKLETLDEIRAAAAENYREMTGNAWRAPSGSYSSRRKAATASVISAGEYLRAQKVKEAQLKCPDGPRIAFAGDPKGGNIKAVEAALDLVRAKYPDMVLIHSNYAKGDDRIARNWAERCEVPQVVVSMDFDKHGKRAGFVRNEKMIELGLKGVILMPGNGVTANLGQKAEEAGVNVLRAKAH